MAAVPVIEQLTILKVNLMLTKEKENQVSKPNRMDESVD